VHSLTKKPNKPLRQFGGVNDEQKGASF